MVKVSKYSDIGGREKNEDSCIVAYNETMICVAVADGLGGHGKGDTASAIATSVIARNMPKAEKVDSNLLCSWFKRANEEILDEQQVSGVKMRTTMAALCLNDRIAFWAHVGDTRIYHFVDGKIVSMTFDHSVSQMAVLTGEISQDAVRGHVDRSRLLRALGKDEDVNVESGQPVDISRGWHAFLLCTDGFWEYVLEKEMEEALALSGSPREWLDRMKRVLWSRACGAYDNNTAVCVWASME